jgi:hypothetical protein
MRALTQAATFKTPGELLFGCLLLYQFRIFERQAGSSKFGAYAVAVTGVSYAVQLLVDRALRWDAPPPPAPLPLLFASFLPFLLDVPALSHFSVLGWQLSDKVGLRGDHVRRLSMGWDLELIPEVKGPGLG